MLQKKPFDVIVIGGGPAGMSAALILARCVRSVLIFDSGRPRNFKAKSMNGFISRDGSNPMEFLRTTREQLQKYPVVFKNNKVEKINKLDDNSFEIIDSEYNRYYSKKVLLATGLIDEIPDIGNIHKFYGSSVHHCPYCDGWELRLKPLAVVGKGKSGVGLALSLTNWSDDIVLLTNGKEISKEEKEKLVLKNIEILDKKVDRLEGDSGQIEKIYFNDGSFIERCALFFTTEQFQRSNLAEQLGCQFTKKGGVKVNRFQQTSIKGVYVAGDASKDVQLVIMAAAEGAKAAVVINRDLQKEESKLKQISRNIQLHTM
ncbi:MAG: NAD(P)/FAD-dependent oxidoreductase [Cytophagaceae bacterium]